MGENQAQVRYPVTLFVGAGASSPFGFPVCRGFFKDNATSTLKQRRDFRWLVQAVFGPGPIAELNVEDLLDVATLMTARRDPSTGNRREGPVVGMLERLTLAPAQVSEQVRSELSDYWTSIQETKAALAELPRLEDAVRAAVLDVYSRNPTGDPAKHYRLLFDEIHGQFGQDDFPVFTTNYDRVLERVLEDDAGADKYFGFHGVSTLVWSASNYNRFFERSSSKRRYALFKLHGSVGWTWEQRGSDRVLVSGGATRQLAQANHCVLYPAYKGLPTEDVFRFAHDTLAQVLDQTACFIAIGFTFQDPYINNLMGRAFRTNDGLSLALVDSDTESAARSTQRLVDIGVPRERVTVLSKPFGSIELPQTLRTLMAEPPRKSS
jgi:hypothetical protein